MECGGKDSSPCKGESQRLDKNLQTFIEDEKLKDRLAKITHKIMVLSGKGGVGKSTVAANVAVALAMEGKRVGILDVDFHGPSIPKLLKLEGSKMGSNGISLLPVNFVEGIKVVSLGFLLENPDDAVIWRGPMKMGVIKQLLSDVEWGELDYLIMDFPPGTGDEPLSVAQLIPGSDGAIIVTTPQDISLADVRKSINFCRSLNVPVLGVIENMSGLICPHCNTVINIFKAGGGETMAKDMGVPFLGRIPIDPLIVEASDSGLPFVYHYSKTEAAKAFTKAIEPLLNMGAKKESLKKTSVKEDIMERLRIAIPVSGGRLSSHFGHCETFSLFDVERVSRMILKREDVAAPPHEPGLLPAWLHEKGVNVIIAGGMGSRAKDLFAERGIEVITGAPSDTQEDIVKAYLKGTLQTTQENICDH